MTDNAQLIAELRRENEQLKQQMNSLKVALDSMHVYVFTKNLRGEYTYVNANIATLFNLPPEEIVGKTDECFFDLDVSNDIKINDQNVMENGVTIELEEKNVIHQTGETRYYASAKSPLFDDEGNISGLVGISTDITEKRQLDHQLQESRDLLHTIFHHIDACIYLKDADYKFTYVNPKTEEVFGLPLQEIVGKRGEDILPAEIAEIFHATDKQVFNEKRQQSIEEVIGQEDGSNLHYWSIKVPIKNDSGDVEKMIGFSTDITELAKLRLQLKDALDYERQLRVEQQSLAITDPLTGLYNRLKLDEVMTRQILRQKNFSSDLSIILMDVDHFKHVNDTYGHQVGDEVLKEFAQILRQNIRASDVVGRWGGEEFLIICPNTNLEGSSKLAEKLRQVISKTTFTIVGKKTASFGVSSYHAEDTAADVLSRADSQLYLAKQSGRNRVSAQEL